MTPERPPVQVTWDDLQSSDVSARVDQLRAAGAPALVRAVGAAPTPTRNLLRNGIVSLGLAGLAGGLLGWFLAEFITNTRAEESGAGAVHHWYGDNLYVGVCLWTFLLAVGMGSVFASSEALQARSTAKLGRALALSLPVLAVGGVLGGALGQKVFSAKLESAQASANAYLDATGDYSGYRDMLTGAAHVSRSIGFALFGIAVGVALGLSSRSRKRALNGAIGGLVGGAVGGYLFDYVHVGGNGLVSRLISIAITGTVIGIAIGLVEQVRKESWLEIVTGGMAGKQFILYNAQTSVGSGPSCDITLIKDPQVVDRHVLLQRAGSAMRAAALTPGVPFLVNGQPVVEATLSDGDTVQVGSTVLRVREKQGQAPVAGPILG